MRPHNNIRFQKPQTQTVELESLNNASPMRSSSIIRAFAEKPGKVFLLYGDRSVFHVSLQMAAQAMSNGKSIAVVDGCNRFDVHALSRFARIRKIDPNKFLNRIFISRGFTCYQMEQAIAHKLPSFLVHMNSNTALIFGLLDTFFDEQASLREVQKILQRLLISFKKMKANGISLLLVCSEHKVEPPERNQLFTTLKNNVDSVYKLGTNEHGSLQLFLESRRYIKNNPKGILINGKNSTDIYKPDRCRIGKLVKVSPRTTQR